MNIKWLCVITAVVLLLAIPSGLWPYGYYVLLRWVVSISSIIVAYYFYNQKTTSKMIVYILGIVAILFNPIAPIFLSKGAWVILDFITAMLFTVIVIVNKNHI